jgi:hypothetical protein
MKFGKKYTVAGFKASLNISVLQVIKNPKNDKLFLSGDGVTVGGVSNKYDSSLPKQIVEIIDEETGEVMPCLCNIGESDNVQETL